MAQTFIDNLFATATSAGCSQMPAVYRFGFGTSGHSMGTPNLNAKKANNGEGAFEQLDRYFRYDVSDLIRHDHIPEICHNEGKRDWQCYRTTDDTVSYDYADARTQLLSRR